MDQQGIDRNLLFGVIALQDDLIDRAQFTDVCAGWALRMDVPLADLLVERGWIRAEERAEVERKVERKLRKHGGDVHATLTFVADSAAREAIRAAERPALSASVATLPPPSGYVLLETLDLPKTPPAQRSRYTLTRLHAAGGLGKVWVARDTDLNREVALKEIKPEVTLNPEALRRFLKEAQVTGQLEHPNIVPVYELSRRTEDDQPFYTMRFVRGRTLRQAIADDRAARTGGKPDPLGLRNLLSAFVSVCQAIGYAHSRGVIHRDLKPENVVLGGFGEVIVLDWGLAKTTGQPEDSDEGTVAVSEQATTDATQGPMGTPAYMAPEQAAGRHDQVDARTDIYGLGAILFEILTGSPPHAGSSTRDVLARIVDRASPLALDADPTAPPALAAICARAMSKSRADRYPRALDLAEDVQRWLADEPVSVYRDPSLVRLARWSRRHMPAVAASAALVITGVTALSIHSVLIGKQKAIAVANADEAGRQKTIAEGQRDLAERNFRKALAAVDQMLTEVGSVELAEVPQMESVRKKLLLRARAFYEGFLAERAHDPAVRREAGKAYGRLAEIADELGEWRAAERAYRESLGLLEAATPADSGPTRRVELARSQFGLGVLLKKANRFREAEERLREAIRIRERLARESPADDALRADLASARYQLGALLAKVKGRGPADEVAYRGAIRDQEALVARSRGGAEHRRDLARSLNNLGLLLGDGADRASAEAAYRESIALLDGLVRETPKAPAPRWLLAGALSNLGVLLRRDPGAPGAEEALLKAREALEPLRADFPRIPDYRARLAAVENNLGLLYLGTRETARAETCLRRALDLWGALADEYPDAPDYRFKRATTRQNLALLLGSGSGGPDRGADSRVEAMLAESGNELRGLLRESPQAPEYEYAYGANCYHLGHLQAGRGEFSEARDALREAVEHQEVALKAMPDHAALRTALADTCNDYCYVLMRLGDCPGAAEAAERMPALLPDSLRLHLRAAGFLAECAQASAPAQGQGGRYAERAVAVLRRAYEVGLLTDPADLNDRAFGPLAPLASFRRLRTDLARKPTVRTG